MKILQIHNRYRIRGGEDTVADSEATLLRAAGHEVHRLIAHNPNGLDAITGLMRSPSNSRSKREVSHRVETIRPDVAHVHNTWFALSPSVFEALDREGVPTVWTAHNYRFACSNSLFLRDGSPCTDCLGRSPWRAVRYSCYRDPISSAFAAATIARSKREGAFTSKADIAVALTRFSRDLMIEAGFTPDRVVVKPNFTEDPGTRQVRAGDSDFLLFVGRLSAEKGIEVAVDAWRRLGGDLRLVVVGEGAFGTENAPSGVEFYGALPRADVLDLMLRARALVFPSLWFEGQPMVLLEALAAGLPILGSDIGALPELVSSPAFDGLFPTGDSLALAERIAALDDRTANLASQAARERWASDFSPSAGIEGLEHVYRLAIGARRS